jgi:hypothetical protein
MEEAVSSIKLEEGKYYLNRVGEKVGPVRNRAEAIGYLDAVFTYPWDLNDDTEETWTDDGRHRTDREDPRDLVAEWVDEPPAPALQQAAADWAETEFIDSRPERVKILADGATLTNGDRDDEYGPPFNNMTCAGELKAAFRKWLARDIRPGELEAIDMALTKISRLACGKPKRDTYVDAATYMAIAGEVGLGKEWTPTNGPCPF